MNVLFPTVRSKRCHISKWVPFCAALLLGGLQAVYASQTIDSGTTTWSGNGTVNGDLVVGSSGTGTLKVTANTTNVSGGNSYFGSKAGSLGTVQITGGTLGSGNLTEVGDAGTGILNISGGTLTTGTLLLGNNATGNGTVTLSSGTLKSDQSDTIIGNSGTGTFSQSGGYYSSVANLQIGKNSTGVGSATLTGGTTVIAKAINVGVAGAGSLTVAGSAIMQVGSGTVALGGNTGGMGTLNLGNGGAFTGVLSASTGNMVVTTGSGAGTVNFNTSNAVSYGYRLQGNLSVNQIGSGTTTLTGSSNYTGLTSITSGELDVNGSLLNDNYNGTLLNTGTISVSSGGVLGGSGTVGIVNITNGSIKGSGLLASLATFRGISTLSGTSTLYHGFTVASGTLNFSGVANIAGNDGAAHIASGATMKSTGGTIGEGGRGVITSTGGTLVVESGTLSAFYLSLDSASTLQMQISGSNGSTTGELDVSNLSLAGTLDLTGLGNLTVIGTTITLINLQQGSLINTIFDAVTVSGTSVTLTPRQSYYYPNAEYEETFTTSDGAEYELTYKGGSDGADITVTLLAVPEPSTWALLLGGMGMLWLLRLRNKQGVKLVD